MLLLATKALWALCGRLFYSKAGHSRNQDDIKAQTEQHGREAATVAAMAQGDLQARTATAAASMAQAEEHTREGATAEGSG